MKRTFRVKKVEVGGFNTRFSIVDLDHENKQNSMSPEALIHHLGRLQGLELEEIEGMEFTVTFDVVDKDKKFRDADPLDLCGKTIGGGRTITKVY